MEKVNVKLEDLLKMPMDVLQRHTKMLKFEGVILILLGVLAIAMPLVFTKAVEFILGVLLVIGGIGGLASSFKVKNIPGVIFSIISYLFFLIAGILLITKPMIGVLTLAMIMGFFFVFSGLSKIAFAFNVKPAKNWGWSLLDGVLCLVLAAVVFAEWPNSAAWIVGLIIGIRLLFMGNAMIMIGRGLEHSAQNQNSAAPEEPAKEVKESTEDAEE